MANRIITPDMIAREANMMLENEFVWGNLVYRAHEREWNQTHNGYKIGDQVRIQNPVKFQAADGAPLVLQDVIESNTFLQVNNRKHVAWAFDTQQLTLDITDYSEKYIRPAMSELANEIELSIARTAIEFWNFSGTPGTAPNTFADLAQTAELMDDLAIPDDGNRRFITNPAGGWSLADGLKGVFVQDKVRTALERGTVGRYANFEPVAKSQIVYRHTVGDVGGTPLVNGAGQEVNVADPDLLKAALDIRGQVLNTDGWTGADIQAGDVFTIAGVFSVNPKNGQSTEKLQHFVVRTTNAIAGARALDVSPPIITSGAYQTVTAAPADNAVITVVTGAPGVSYAQNLGFHRNAIALAVVPLEMPAEPVFKARNSYKGYNVRVLRVYDQNLDTDVIRIDVLWATKAIYPELGVRHTG